MPPLVSVCLPVFNGEKYLAAAIQSILDQTYSNWELIICDDGSTDLSVEVVNRFASKEKRIRFEPNKNRLGLFSNYNKCIDMAKGEYIKLFAQDDLLDARAIETGLNLLDSHQTVALVSSAKHWLDENGQVVETIREFESDTELAPVDVIFDNLNRYTNWVGEPSCVMFRKQHAGTGFDTNLYHSGDIEYWFRILQHGSLLYLADVLCSFRRHSGSESSYNLRSLSFVIDLMRMGRTYQDLLKERGVSKQKYLEGAVRSAARVVFSLVDDEDVACADTSRFDQMDGESAKQNLAFMTILCFQALYDLVFEQEKASAIRHDLTTELHKTEEQLAAVLDSLSWKVTKPIREIKRQLKS